MVSGASGFIHYKSIATNAIFMMGARAGAKRIAAFIIVASGTATSGTWNLNAAALKFRKNHLTSYFLKERYYRLI